MELFKFLVGEAISWILFLTVLLGLMSLQGHYLSQPVPKNTNVTVPSNWQVQE